MVSSHSRKNAARSWRGPGQNHRQAVEAVRRDRSARVLVSAGDRVPRGRSGHPDIPMEYGDVLEFTCPAGTAKVIEVWSDHTVIVEWPWTSPDATRRPTFAVTIPEDGVSRIGLHQLSTPLTRGVGEGHTFTVQVPPTVAHVHYTTSQWMAADRDAGRPPADSHALVAVLPYGVTHQFGAPDTSLLLRPWNGDPWTVRLLCRPYEALPDGAEVVDAEGTRWHYTGPLDFHTTARATARTVGPAWPLTLTSVHTFEPKPEEVAAVAAATATGRHEDELDAWRRASGADLAPYEDAVPAPEGYSEAELEQLAAHTRAQAALMTRKQLADEREQARVTYRLVSKVVDDEEDWKRVQAAQTRLDTLDQALAERDAQMTAARAVVRDAVKEAFPGPAPACCGHVTCNGDDPCDYIVVGLVTDSVRCDCHGDGPSDGVRAWLTP